MGSIDARVEADIEQAMERLRSLIRQEEQLTFYFVGDYDLSFLGVPVEQVEAFLIAPEADTAAQITRWKIQEAFGQLTGSGEKITQRKLAIEATHPDALSQIAITVKAYGVNGFLRILQSSPLPTQVRLLSRIVEVMPEEVRQELRSLF
jgi:AcrR family transcriptional regulator